MKDPNPPRRIALVQAVAGSGKTTTIVEGAKFIPPTQRVCFVAFARKNVQDLKAKLPANIEASTLNSKGNRAWLKFIGRWKMEINKDLNYKLINELIDPETGKLSSVIAKSLQDRHRSIHGIGMELERYTRLLGGNFGEEVSDISRLIGLAKNCGLVPNELIEATGYDYKVLLEDSRDNWLGMIETYDLAINFPDVAIEVARKVLVKSVVMANEEIDYDSQLWLPVIHRAPFDQYDWVLIDEVQDLNSVQMEIITAIMKPDARAVGVGDRFQAIYNFRGSLSSSMDFFKGRFEAVEFPLSICYRCAKSIVSHAREVVPHIESFEGQDDGYLVDVSKYGSSLFTKNDAVICRNSAPLVSLACKLYKEKYPCKILGEDIQHGLVKLINRCKPKDGDLDVLNSRLKEMYNKELEKDRRRGSYFRSESMKDKMDSIEVFTDELKGGRRSVDALIEKINRVFGMDRLNKEQMLVLSTCHRIKGAEHPNVYILDSHLMPSRRAKSKESIQAEMNLIYVARTRAKKKLGYISSKGYDEKCKFPSFEPLSNRVEVKELVEELV